MASFNPRFLLFLKKAGFTPCMAEQPLRGMELQENEGHKRLKHATNLFGKNLQIKVSGNSKTSSPVDHRSKKIPEFSYRREDTVDIDILIASRNGGRKIMQSIRIMSRHPMIKRK